MNTNATQQTYSRSIKCRLSSTILIIRHFFPKFGLHFQNFKIVNCSEVNETLVNDFVNVTDVV